ncbi:HAD family hydrolase [Acetivibrio mesophilus]|uniref:HAD family hydrolase n=2 Tax=Acetivibrio mesophilus TaxID=2487273 RepID=A0A4Q0IB77_9FIRM|nr:HAD family hydrolase [Acetivibrio mesophilus]
MYKEEEPTLFKSFLANEINGEEYMLLRYACTLERMGIIKSKEIASDLQQEYITQINNLEDKDMAATVLTTLKGKGFKLFVLTNGPSRSQRLKLEVLKIKNLFDGIYISEEIKYAKPDVKAIEFLLQTEKLLKEETLMVGDSIEYDIRTAENIGLATILIDRKRQYLNYRNIKIERLNEICKVICSINKENICMGD